MTCCCHTNAVFAALANDASGAPIVALLSCVKFGSATTAGVELGATYLLPSGWRVQGSYTGFHSSVSDLPENPLLLRDDPSLMQFLRNL